MKRILIIGVFGVAALICAFLYVKSTQDPPIPKIEMATPENTHGKSPSKTVGAG